MNTCFIILPMKTPDSYPSGHFDKVLHEICVPAVKMRRFKPILPDEPGTHPIDEKILAQLRNADMVLCDISSLNPNVLYELGIRSALNKPFAIIKDGQTSVPFDLTNFRHCAYDMNVIHEGREAKEALVKKVAEHLGRTRALKLPFAEEPVKGAAACGITEIFFSRESAEKEILGAIKDAGSRLWILGIGLSQVFSLPENLRIIEEKGEAVGRGRAKFDTKILMLDALTSTGVFRTLLESSAEKADEIIYASRDYGDDRQDDPYFNEQLYQDFENVWKRFKGRHGIDNIIRFYGHSPSCWLVIADDTAYFQPYTFGSAPDSKKKKKGGPIGHLMPVFKFDGGSGARPFKILEDHFRKLWLTTNTDLFHVRARNAGAEDTVHEILRARSHWLRQVHGVLNKPGREQRQYPRKRCKSSLNNYVRKDTKAATSQDAVKVEKVINFSREGLAFKLKNIKLKKDDRVRVEVRPWPRPKGQPRGRGGKREKAGDHVKKMLVDPHDGKFRVAYARKEGEFLIVGLQPIKKKLSRRTGAVR